MLSGAKEFLQTFPKTLSYIGYGSPVEVTTHLHHKCNDDEPCGNIIRRVACHVTGSDLTLPEHVARQAGVKRVTVHEARGRLIAGLDNLARAWL